MAQKIEIVVRYACIEGPYVSIACSYGMDCQGKLLL